MAVVDPVSQLVIFDDLPLLADDNQLYALLQNADQMGVRMEVIESGFVWEAAPGKQHQKYVLAITNSVRGGSPITKCDCFKLHDVYVRLPDGLAMRPDVSVFCSEPPEEEGFIHAVPEAVIEITSPGYEEKDLIYGPPIYIRNGVKDVLALDRRSGTVHHWFGNSRQVFTSPHDFILACGCLITV